LIQVIHATHFINAEEEIHVILEQLKFKTKIDFWKTCRYEYVSDRRGNRLEDVVVIVLRCKLN